MTENRIKRVTRWCIGTWHGALISSIFLASMVMVPVYAYHNTKLFLPKDLAYRPINDHGLDSQWYLLQPELFGVTSWNVGDVARYDFQDNRRKERRPIQFGIVGKLEKDHAVSTRLEIPAEDMYWLQVSGFKNFRELHTDILHLSSKADLRIKRSSTSLLTQVGYIPLHNSAFDDLPLPPFPVLKQVGDETIETAAGKIPCKKFDVTVGDTLIKVWANGNIPPLGIVRIENKDQRLDLVSYASNEKIAVQEVYAPILDGRSTISVGCESCHVSYRRCHEPVFPPR